ncbi:hypothetical protein DFH29DRAFT_877803 [Suillus ampliporus]|nr:hypothetical protein DFH29DRAFT_877803 [Suillus ampliporus]
MSPSCLPPFNASAIRIGMSELSNILTGPQWLDFYIRLIPMETVRTELYLLYFLLRGRVYLGDIWQIVGECLLEAQREESLQSTIGDGTAFITASPSSCPNLSPLLPEDVCHYKEYINAESLDNSSSKDLCCNCFRKDVDGIKFVDSGGCLYSSKIVSLASDWLGNTVVQILFEKCSSVPQFAMLETITPHLAMNGIHNCTWTAQKIFEHVQIPEEIQHWGLTSEASSKACRSCRDRVKGGTSQPDDGSLTNEDASEDEL